MTNFKITKYGKDLDKSKYTWYEEIKTLSTNENNLTLDFSWINWVTFRTGSNCTFNTGYNCTFHAGYYCTFNTSYNCIFNTSANCTFNTSSNCTFDTSSDCTFNTGSNCTFNTSADCTFDTNSDCTFRTGYNCTFNTGSNCVVIRIDVHEVIELQEWKKIRLNWCYTEWFTYVAEKPEKTIMIWEYTYNKKDFEKAVKNLKTI